MFEHIQGDAGTILNQEVAQETFFYSIPVTKVSHYTHIKEACNIIDKWHFTASCKFADMKEHKIQNSFGQHIDQAQDFNVVWFSADIETPVSELKNSLMNALQPTVDPATAEAAVCARFNSPIFKGSRYGGIGFSISWQDLLAQCSSIWVKCGYTATPVYRVLGTFTYKRECMHALLVCASDDNRFARFPVLTNNDPVLQRTATGWEWHLRSTTDYDQKFEVLAFAVAIPLGSVLSLPRAPSLKRVPRITKNKLVK